MLLKTWSGHGGLCCLVLICTVQFWIFHFQKSSCSLFSRTSSSERSKHSISGQVSSVWWRIPLLETTEKMREELLLLSPFKESISSQRENSAYPSGGWGRWRKLFIASLGLTEVVPVGIAVHGLDLRTGWRGSGVKELAGKGQRKFDSLLLWIQFKKKTPQNQTTKKQPSSFLSLSPPHWFLLKSTS